VGVFGKTFVWRQARTPSRGSIETPRPRLPGCAAVVKISFYKEVTARMAAKEGYCVKCKAKREIKDAQEITMKNGRPATQGLCPECGTKIFKIGKS